MNTEKLQKMFTSGDSAQVRMACSELMDGLAKLERNVAALEAQPFHAEPTGYRVVEKGYDDGMAGGDSHYGTMNGKPLDLDALARDVRKYAAG